MISSCQGLGLSSLTTSHINSNDKFNRKDILYSKYNIDMIYYLNRFPLTCYLGLLSSSLNPIVKVLIGRADCVCINATIVDESTPPERKAPKGTSDIICCLTEVIKSFSSSSLISSILEDKGLFTPYTAVSAKDQ